MRGHPEVIAVEGTKPTRDPSLILLLSSLLSYTSVLVCANAEPSLLNSVDIA